MKKALCILVLLSLLTFAAYAEGITQDRAGNAIAVPEKIERIVSLAPSTTQIICDLGLADRLVAVDTQSPLYADIPAELPQFDLMTPDIELLASLEPDIIFTTGMAYIEGNPYALLNSLGICVAEIPSSESLSGVMDDVRFVAACLGHAEDGEKLMKDMQDTIDAVAAVGAGITERKRVLFEISALPAIYSFGSGTFLDEMITLIGAENIFGDQFSWIAVTEEQAVAADPDVILTNVNYIEDPVGEILARPGWDAVTAVKNGEVCYIDNAASSIPNHHVTQALLEMANAVYPEAYASLSAQ